MDVMHVLLGLFELVLTVTMAVGVVFVNYQIAIRTNPDYDTEQELQKANMGVAILLASCLVSAGLIVKSGLLPVVSMLRLAITSRGAYLPGSTAILIAVIQIVLVFVTAVISISFSLRLFGRLTRRIKEGRELQMGNPAVGTILAAVVFVVALFVSDSMSGLTRSLVPETPLGNTVGTIQIMR